MARLRDMVKVAVTGTPVAGPITLGAAVPGFLSFAAAGVADGEIVSYGAGDMLSNGNFLVWEVGRGTYSGGVLSRGPLFSSNSGGPVDLTSTAVVWITVLSEDLQVFLGGNTAGVSSVLLPDLTLAGGSNVTLSGSDGAITINAGGGISSLNLFAVGNTTGQSSSTTVGNILSFDGAGIASLGFSAGSIVVSASSLQSAQTLGLFALGNTTGGATSGTIDARSFDISGAGAVSVGLTGSSLLISAPIVTTAASGTALQRFAIGNTTGSTTSDAASLTRWTFSGAGGASVGLSGNTLIVSGATTAAQTVQTLGLFAVGNTTTSVSSMTADARSLSFDGAGIVSIGMSGGSIVISASSGTTAASGTALGRTVVGNTTGTTTADLGPLTQWTISAAGGLSAGLSGSTLVLSGATTAAQSVQTLGLFAVGNTAGSTTSQTADARTISFEGSGVASVGFSNGSIVINAPAAAATNPLLSIYAVGNTTDSTTSGANAPGSLSFDGAGIVSVGVSGSSVVISASSAAQTAAGLSLFAVGNTTTSTSSGVIQAGSLSFDGAGAVSVGISGSSVVISAPATIASATSMGLMATGNTTGTTSSQTHALTGSTLSGGGIVSVGFNAGTMIISATSAAQTAPTLNLFAVGNTTDSTTSAAITGAVSFDGAGAISIGLSGSSVVISAPAQSAAALNVYAVGNTTDSTTSGAIGAGSLSFDGAGGVSVGISGSSVVISGATTVAQSVQTIGAFATGNTTGSSSSTTFDARSFTISGAGGASVGYSSNNILIVSGATTLASGTIQNRAAIGNTTSDSSSAVGTLSVFSISGAGGVSVGYATNSSGVLVISGATTVASATADNLFALGNTTGATSSTTQTLTNFSVSGAGGVSIGFSTTGAGAGVMIVSGAVPAASAASMNMTAIGNTTGSSSATTRAITEQTLSGAGIVSVGFSGNSIVISASTAATNPLLSLYAVGNTTTSASSGVIAAGSLSFDGAGAVSVGVSGSSIVISAPATIASATSMGLSALGNTTGTTTSMTKALTAETISFAGGISGGFSDGTFVISGATGSAASAYATLSFYREPINAISGATSTTGMPLGTFACAPLNPAGIVSFNNVKVVHAVALSSATITVTTAAGTSSLTAKVGSTITALLGHYTSANATNFSSAGSASLVLIYDYLYSISRNGASNSVSCTVSFQFGAGSVTSADTYSTSTSSNASSNYVLNPVGASSVSYQGGVNMVFPMSSTLSPGFQIMAVGLTNAVSASAAGGTGVSIGQNSWFWRLATVRALSSSGAIRIHPGNTQNAFYYGAGWTSTAGSGLPVSVVATLLSQNTNAAVIDIPMIEMGMS